MGLLTKGEPSVWKLLCRVVGRQSQGEHHPNQVGLDVRDSKITALAPGTAEYTQSPNTCKPSMVKRQCPEGIPMDSTNTQKTLLSPQLMGWP